MPGSNEGSGEKLAEKSGEKAADKSGEKAAEKSGDQRITFSSLEGSGEKVAKKSEDKAADKWGEKVAEKSGDSRITPSSLEGSGEKVAKKSEEKAAEKSGDQRTKETVTHNRSEVGKVLWCESGVYLIIAVVFLLILGLFNFFGGKKSKIMAAIKLIFMIGFTAAVAYAVFKKHVRAMSGVLIATLVAIEFSIISILISIFDEPAFCQKLISIVLAGAQIVFFGHFFFVASSVRSVYKKWKEELPR